LFWIYIQTWRKIYIYTHGAELCFFYMYTHIETKHIYTHMELVFLFLCVYTHGALAHMSVYDICIYMLTCMCVCAFVCVICMHIYTHMCVKIYVCMCTVFRARVFLEVMYIYIHVFI